MTVSSVQKTFKRLNDCGPTPCLAGDAVDGAEVPFIIQQIAVEKDKNQDSSIFSKSSENIFWWLTTSVFVQSMICPIYPCVAGNMSYLQATIDV